MNYTLTFDPAVLKTLKKLDPPVKQRIVSKIKDLRKNPRHFGKPLSGIDLWRLRVGDYRVLFDLYEEEREIHIVKVAHRSDVYRDL